DHALRRARRGGGTGPLGPSSSRPRDTWGWLRRPSCVAVALLHTATMTAFGALAVPAAWIAYSASRLAAVELGRRRLIPPHRARFHSAVDGSFQGGTWNGQKKCPNPICRCPRGSNPAGGLHDRRGDGSHERRGGLWAGRRAPESDRLQPADAEAVGGSHHLDAAFHCEC